jgi:hypothetical protein
MSGSHPRGLEPRGRAASDQSGRHMHMHAPAQRVTAFGSMVWAMVDIVEILSKNVTNMPRCARQVETDKTNFLSPIGNLYYLSFR